MATGDLANATRSFPPRRYSWGMANDQKRRAVHAIRLLNDFIGDLVAGAEIIEGFKDAPDNIQIGVTRVSVSHLVLTLAKLDELRGHYQDLFPQNLVSPFQEFHKQIEERGIKDFRNTVIAHIWDTKEARPPTYGQIDQKFRRAIRNDSEAFRQWINPKGGAPDPSAVVGLVELLRDGLKEKFSLNDDEWVS